MNDLNRSSPEMESEEIGNQGAEALVHTLRVLFFVLRIAIILVFIYLPFSGWFILKPTEQAMIFRFGKLIQKEAVVGNDKEGHDCHDEDSHDANHRHTVNSDGKMVHNTDVLLAGSWYAAFPKPIDRVQRIPKSQTMSVATYQFWPSKSKVALYQDVEGKKILKEDFKKIQVGRDGYLISGDQCLVHMVWSMNYQVIDPKCYYLNNYEANVSAFNDINDKIAESGRGFSNDFHPLLQSLLEEAVMIEVAQWSVDEIYANAHKNPDTGANEPINIAVEHRLEEMLKEFDPGLGIEVMRVNMETWTPPVAIIDAFSEVNNAKSQSEKTIQEARNKIVQDRNRALNEAEQIKAAATAYHSRICGLMNVQRRTFLSVQPNYQEYGPPALDKRLSDALAEFYSNCGQKYVVHRRPDGTLDIRLLVTPPPKPKQAPPG